MYMLVKPEQNISSTLVENESSFIQGNGKTKCCLKPWKGFITLDNLTQIEKKNKNLQVPEALLIFWIVVHRKLNKLFKVGNGKQNNSNGRFNRTFSARTRTYKAFQKKTWRMNQLK